MSFDWSDRNVQRAFVYGCFESEKSAEIAIELIKKHVTVNTLTVHDWYEEFRATEHSSERRGRREVEEYSETGQPELKRPRLGSTTDIAESSALTQEIKEEVDDVEDFVTASNTTKTMNLIPPSFIKVEVYEDCNISEIDIYLGVDSVTISKKLTDRSRIPAQEFLYKTEDPTQYSFIHRAISEVKTIFNTPNLKLKKLEIRQDDDKDKANQEKKTLVYDELQQMMAKLSEKLHLGCLKIHVKNPEELIGFLKTIQPESLTELNICNHQRNFDMSQVVLLEHWPKLGTFCCGYFVNIPLSKLAHMSYVIAFISESTTNELKEYFKNLTVAPTFHHSFFMRHPRLESADLVGILEKHKCCEFSNGKQQQCYLLTDGSIISVLSAEGRLSVKKEVDSCRRYDRCYCD